MDPAAGEHERGRDCHAGRGVLIVCINRRDIMAWLRRVHKKFEKGLLLLHMGLFSVLAPTDGVCEPKVALRNAWTLLPMILPRHPPLHSAGLAVLEWGDGVES